MVCLSDFDDAQMALWYAKENASQRGNTATAIAGSVAAAVRYLAKAMISGDGSEQMFRTPHERKTALGNLESERGIGRDLVVRFLAGVPGMSARVIQSQLASLKHSGIYAKIIASVRDEVEREAERHHNSPLPIECEFA